MMLVLNTILKKVKFDPPLDSFQTRPHAIDLRLQDTVTLKPGERFLCKSLEWVSLPLDVAASVFPRSSMNRRNLTVDMTGVVDAGYEGNLIIPITNNAKVTTVKLLRGERVASMVFWELNMLAEKVQSKYHGGPGNYVPDKADEEKYLVDGDLGGLKLRFPARRA